jgi:hypothetical protein
MGICPCLLPCVGPRATAARKSRARTCTRPSLDRVQNQPLDAKQGGLDTNCLAAAFTPDANEDIRSDRHSSVEACSLVDRFPAALDSGYFRSVRSLLLSRLHIVSFSKHETRGVNHRRQRSPRPPDRALTNDIPTMGLPAPAEEIWNSDPTDQEPFVKAEEKEESASRGRPNGWMFS